jgi:acetolactate synthase-1/3 small subunit
MLEVTGPQDAIDSFLAMIRPYGVRELVRTGPIAMIRGAAAVGPRAAVRDGIAAAAD